MCRTMVLSECFLLCLAQPIYGSFTARLLMLITFTTVPNLRRYFSLLLAICRQFTSPYTKIEMTDAAGRISTLEVRCACGKSCENAKTYFRHKLFCGTHQKENVLRTTPSSDRSFAIVPARASISASSPKPVACWCGRTFKNHHALRQHGCYCAVYKQQTNAHSTSSDPSQVLELNSSADSAPASGERSIPPAKFTVTKTQCLCGQSFANEKALNKHLRYSKTHQVGKPGSSSISKGKTPGSVPFIVPHSPPTPIHPASGPVPGTIPSSVLSRASLFTCTCGHAFETQRVMDLHKRDSLIHKRQAEESPTGYEQWDDSLVTSFASINLESVSTRIMPSGARFSCICGCIFIDQKALEQHKQDARRHAWQVKGERREKKFKTPRPQYQKDEYLHDMAAVLARQYCGGE